METGSPNSGLTTFLARKRQCLRLDTSGIAFLALVMWAWTCRGWHMLSADQRVAQLAANAVPTAALAASVAATQSYRWWRPLALFASRAAMIIAPVSSIIINNAILGKPMTMKGSPALGAAVAAAACECPIGAFTLLFFATRALGVCLLAFDNDLDVGPAVAAQLTLAAMSRQADAAMCTSPLAASDGMMEALRLAHFAFKGALAPGEIEAPGTSLLALCYAFKAVFTALPVLVAARRQAARETPRAAGGRQSARPSAAAAKISAAVDALQARPLQGALASLLTLQLLWAACYTTAQRTCAAP